MEEGGWERDGRRGVGRKGEWEMEEEGVSELWGEGESK